jgi:hypothetical protein
MIPLNPFAEKLTGWLKTEAGKSRKQRRTLKQLYGSVDGLDALSLRHGFRPSF